MNNPNSPWRNKPFQTTINANSPEELNMRIADKEKEGFKVVHKNDYYAGYGLRKYIAVVRKVS